MDISEIDYKYYYSSTQQTEIIQALEQIEKSDWIALDTETTGLDPLHSRIRLLQLGIQDKIFLFDCFKLGWDENPLSVPKLLRNLLESPQKIKIIQNANFDWKFIRLRLGISIDGIFDTLLASILLAAGDRKIKHSLKNILFREMGLFLDKEMQKSNWGDDLNEEQLKYAARDVIYLNPLREKLKEKLIASGQEKIAKIEFYCLPAISQMELDGVFLDKQKWVEIIDNFKLKKEKIVGQLNSKVSATQMNLFSNKTESTLNFNSSMEVKKFFEKQKGIYLPDASETTLKSLIKDYEEADWILKLRHCDKMISTFGDSILQRINLKSNRVHPSYRQISAPSGRMSCTRPNMQQIPKSIGLRNAVMAENDGVFVIADYSQIELRIAAAVSNEKNMLDAFENNQDLHLLTAAQLLRKPVEKISASERQAAKAVNFGFLYGMGAARFKSYAKTQYGVTLSEKDSENWRQRFFEAYPGIAKWQRETPRHANKVREIRTPLGRKINIPEGEEWFSGTLNLPIQGGAAEGIKLAMGRLFRKLPHDDVKLVAMIHDELIYEIKSEKSPEEQKEIRQTIEDGMIHGMNQVIQGKVPITVDTKISPSWSK